MPAYATLRRPPRTLTEVEQARLLKVTGEHARGYRDHVLFSVALGTGLREHELLALDVGDVVDGRRKVKRRVTLRVFKGCESVPGPQEVVLPDSVVYKLGRYLKWKAKRGESVTGDAPLFVSRNGNRLSARQAREVFRNWQKRSGPRPHPLVPCDAPHGMHQRLSPGARHPIGAAIRAAREHRHHDDLRPAQ